MGIILKQSIKSSVYAYIGIALGFITTGLLMPKALTEAQVGLVRLLVSIMFLLSQIANLGFNAAGGRLFPYFRNFEKKHNGYLFWAVIITTIGLIFTLGALSINYQSVLRFLNVKASPLLNDYFFWIFPLTIFSVFFMVFDNYARMLYDTVSGTFLREFLQRVFLFLSVLFLLFNWVNFNNFIAFYCIGLCLPTIIMLFKIYKSGNLFFAPIKGFWTNKIRKEFISLSILTFLSGFTSQVVLYLDQIQVTSILDLKANGIYATMMMFGTVIYTPAIHISRIGGTIVAEAWKSNDMKVIKEVYEKSCLNLLIIGFFIFILIVTNLHNVFEILPAYETGKWVVIWIGIGKLFDMATGLNGLILQSSKYYYYDILFMILLIFGTWIMNLWLIPLYGITGSAIATTSIIFVFNIFRTLFVWFVFNLFPFSAKNIYVVFISIFVFAIVHFIPKIDGIGFLKGYIIDTFIRSLIASLLFGFIFYFTKLSVDINLVFEKIIDRISKLIKS